MKKYITLFLILLSPQFLLAASLRVSLVGDSTVQSYKTSQTKMRGWGQILPEFFSSDVAFTNEAISGQSTKSFPAEKWQKVLREKPDFVLIQFGHNDAHGPNRPESTNAETDYKENLQRYIREAREAGIKPILVTPPYRRVFKEDGTLNQTLTPYAKAMREVALETSVPLIDLYSETGALFAKLGKSGTEPYFMNRLERNENRAEDLTHFTEQGARVLATIVAEQLSTQVPEFRAAFADSTTNTNQSQPDSLN